jgi:hypothetical protein
MEETTEGANDRSDDDEPDPVHGGEMPAARGMET